jgi:molybdenum cofactor cytidylyltransferase
MNFTQALPIAVGDIIAFVGAGGKTRSMFRFADELMRAGWRVVSTTTTRVSQDELQYAPWRIALGASVRLPDTLAEEVERQRHVFVFTKLEANNKVRGVPPGWLDSYLSPVSCCDVLLVESDGSRRLSLKAPMPHEPVIPSSATIVMPIVGLDVLGQPLDDNHVYGANLITQEFGYAAGDPVTPDVIVSVLLNPRFGLKNIPPRARIVPLLNKVSESARPVAREISAYLLRNPAVERVLIGTMSETEPIHEVQQRVGAVILAAGESRRMGQPKMLLPWGNTTIIRQVCQRVVASPGLHEVVVVAGRWQEDIQKQLADLPVRVIQNPRYADAEMLSSLKIGLEAIWESCDACMVVLGDQPSIEQAVIGQVLQAYAELRGQIVVPVYANRRGHPLVIDRSFWGAILDLPENAAPRDVLRANRQAVYPLNVNTPTVVEDIDTPDDYGQASRRSG